ncbi:YdeI family protein [Flavobacterium sp. NKUCC04_CG]|uniref:YdeI/OmpD-associated family protein n=1 Tax=Flavobacterium sp. NKUCC04_CG TaxID=2842121 RepID=UPI00351D433F
MGPNHQFGLFIIQKSQTFLQLVGEKQWMKRFALVGLIVQQKKLMILRLYNILVNVSLKVFGLKSTKRSFDSSLDNERMTKAGFKSIEIVKQNGSWTILDEVEELIIPADLEIAFNKHKDSKDYFLSLSKSKRKMILSWIVLAKRQETKQKRIDEVVESMLKKQLPKQLT